MDINSFYLAINSLDEIVNSGLRQTYEVDKKTNFQ